MTASETGREGHSWAQRRHSWAQRQDVGGGMAAAVAAEATTAVATAAAAAWILRAHRTAQGQHCSVEHEEVEVPEGDSYGQCWVCPLDTPKHRHGSTSATSKMKQSGSASASKTLHERREL